MRTLCGWLILGYLAVLGCSEHERLIWPDTALGATSAEPEERTEPEAVAAEPSAESAAPVQEPPVRSELVDVAGSQFTPGASPAVNEAAGLPRIVSLTGPAAVTNGGTARLRVSLEPVVQAPWFVVSVEGDTGYHTVAGTEPDADGIAEIEVQIRAGARGSSIVIAVAPTDDKGQVGEYRRLTIPLVASGVGDVKITLSFEPIHDLDLHVIEPGGIEISFMHPKSASGAQLDLDSGSNCQPGLANAENIFWPPGAAPAGEYRVLVRDFEQCDRGPIAFSVRIENGAQVDTYRNTFADRAAGTSIEVATFMH